MCDNFIFRAPLVQCVSGFSLLWLDRQRSFGRVPLSVASSARLLSGACACARLWAAFSECSVRIWTRCWLLLFCLFATSAFCMRFASFGSLLSGNSGSGRGPLSCTSPRVGNYLVFNVSRVLIANLGLVGLTCQSTFPPRRPLCSVATRSLPVAFPSLLSCRCWSALCIGMLQLGKVPTLSLYLARLCLAVLVSVALPLLSLCWPVSRLW